MSRLGGMSRWGLWSLLVALALPAGADWTLICDMGSPAAMPCCRESIADCAQPEMTQDCCRMVPASSHRVALSTRATLQEGSWHPWSLAPVPGVTSLLDLSLGAAQSPPVQGRSLRPHVPPFSSRTTVLRI